MRRDVYKGRRALVVGMARSGIEAALLLREQGAAVSLYDNKPQEGIKDLERLENMAYDGFFGGAMPEVAQFDLIVVSPGVPPEIPLLSAAREIGIEVIGEVEMAYRCAEGQFVGITGTNGKTTTTALVGEMFKAGGFKTHVVGNIGIPVSGAVLTADDPQTYYITELSSYQLESVIHFKPIAGALLNITPDHLARHKTMSVYTEAKLKMVENLERPSGFVINGDQANTAALISRFPMATVFSKCDAKAAIGVDLVDGEDWIVIRDEAAHAVHPVLPVAQMRLVGEHNLENALAAVALCHLCQVPVAAMAKALSEFSGYEHRIEYVGNFDGVVYFNDSKATNPEASIPAIRAMSAPTVLIAGGMDKGSDYRPWIEAFKHIKYVILFGETKNDIAEALTRYSAVPFTVVDTLEAATDMAKAMAQPGEQVLLSPACASWDMFESFEQRGDLFKQLVKSR